MINIISEILIKTKNDKVLKLVADGLIYMTQYIKEEDMAETVLTAVIRMGQDNDDEQRKERAMYLFGSLASYVSSELIQCYAISQVNLFVNDESNRVRREVARQFIYICEKKK